MSKLTGQQSVFTASPPKISYELINDWTTAVTAMKDENIDALYACQPKLFHDLQSNDAFKCKFNLFTPGELSYVYAGINMKNEKFTDVKKVRKALAYLTDRKTRY